MDKRTWETSEQRARVEAGAPCIDCGGNLAICECDRPLSGLTVAAFAVAAVAVIPLVAAVKLYDALRRG